MNELVYIALSQVSHSWGVGWGRKLQVEKQRKRRRGRTKGGVDQRKNWLGKNKSRPSRAKKRFQKKFERNGNRNTA